MRLAIIAPLTSLEEQYSIAGTVIDQINTFTSVVDGIDLYVYKNFKSNKVLPSNVKILAEIPATKTHEYYTNNTTEYYATVEECRELFSNISSDIIFTHDIFLLEDLKVLAAGFSAATKTQTAYHWVHSSVLYNKQAYPTIPKEDFIIALNAFEVNHLAKLHCIPKSQIKVIPHIVDIDTLLDLGESTKAILEKTKFLNNDIRIVIPARLDRGKQPNLVIDLALAFQQEGKSVGVIVCDSYSTGERFQTFIKELKEQGASINLFFTSDLDPSWKLGVSQKVVSDLFKVSNLFVLPSTSETFSKVLFEAALHGNFIVGNRDLWQLRFFFGYEYSPQLTDTTYLMEFGSSVRPIKDFLPNKREYFAHHAKTILSHLATQQIWNSRNAALDLRPEAWLFNYGQALLTQNQK